MFDRRNAEKLSNGFIQAFAKTLQGLVFSRQPSTLVTRHMKLGSERGIVVTNLNEGALGPIRKLLNVHKTSTISTPGAINAFVLPECFINPKAV